MHLTHRHIDVFRALMGAGSVTAAAAALHSSQPTVSRELARLESVLGLPLFDRVRGRLLPNAQARSLFDEVQRSFAGLERIAAAAERLRAAPDGTVDIACLPTFAQSLLPGACARYLADLPQGRVAIAPLESPLLEQSMSMQAHDLGVVEHDQPVAGTVSTLLLDIAEVAVLPAGHALVAKTRLSPRDFAGLPFVDLAPGDVYRQRIDDWFAAAGVQRRRVVETSSAASVCAMVARGVGVGVVNALTALDHAADGVVMCPLSRRIGFRVGLLRPVHRPGNAAVDRFATALQAEAAAIGRRLASARRSAA